MADFPMCVTPSQRELAQLTEQERLTAQLKVKERKKAAKAKPKKILGGLLMVNHMKMWHQHRERIKGRSARWTPKRPTFRRPASPE